MNDELYKMLTLDRVRDFANEDESHLNEDDIATIFVWLHNLDNEVQKLQAQFRRALWEKW